MSELSYFENIDLEYENSSVRVIALKDLISFQISDIVIGPLQKGREITIKYWIATELVKSGFAKFAEDELISLTDLNKIHWRETKIQIGLKISPIPKFLYPRLRRYLNNLKENAIKNLSANNEYNQALRLVNDIINCRLRKIATLSTSLSKNDAIFQNLSEEEKALYNWFYEAITGWKAKILSELDKND